MTTRTSGTAKWNTTLPDLQNTTFPLLSSLSFSHNICNHTAGKVTFPFRKSTSTRVLAGLNPCLFNFSSTLNVGISSPSAAKNQHLSGFKTQFSVFDHSDKQAS